MGKGEKMSEIRKIEIHKMLLRRQDKSVEEQYMVDMHTEPVGEQKKVVSMMFETKDGAGAFIRKKIDELFGVEYKVTPKDES